MPKSLKELCYSDPSISSYVNNRARKLNRVYKNLYDVEDLEHELWVHAFESIDKRYNGQKPLAEFVKADVYSAYGHLLPNKGSVLQNREWFYSSNTEPIPTEGVLYESKDYMVIESRMTLDQIESDLKARYNEARYYQLGYKQLRYFRKNDTTNARAFSRLIGISKTHSSLVFNFVKEVASKYACGGAMETQRDTCNWRRQHG